jgi:hypothetical protein
MNRDPALVDLAALERSVDGACAEIARLRAQREELLAALRAFVHAVGQCTTPAAWMHELEQAIDAIAKAEGR